MGNVFFSTFIFNSIVEYMKIKQCKVVIQSIRYEQDCYLQWDQSYIMWGNGAAYVTHQFIHKGKKMELFTVLVLKYYIVLSNFLKNS